MQRAKSFLKFVSTPTAQTFKKYVACCKLGVSKIKALCCSPLRRLLLAARAEQQLPRLRLHPRPALRHPRGADVHLRLLLLHRGHHRRAVSAIVFLQKLVGG